MQSARGPWPNGAADGRGPGRVLPSPRTARAVPSGPGCSRTRGVCHGSPRTRGCACSSSACSGRDSNCGRSQGTGTWQSQRSASKAIRPCPAWRRGVPSWARLCCGGHPACCRSGGGSPACCWNGSEHAGGAETPARRGAAVWCDRGRGICRADRRECVRCPADVPTEVRCGAVPVPHCVGQGARGQVRR